jgi:restriction endonuclease S subunit
MSSASTRRVQFATEIIASQINPEDFGDSEVVHYSIPALQETGKPIIEAANGIASSKWRLQGGEVLVSKLNVHKNCVAMVETHGELPLLGSTEFVPLLPKNIDARFLKYVFQGEDAIQRLMSFSESATRSHSRVNPSDIIKLKVNQPDLTFQRQIANYLDRETARIDKLIAEKERMLALLDEKRSALISRVVTRGLDPNVPLKPSGLEWLGEIPAHWELRRIKFVSDWLDQGSSPIAANTPAAPGEFGVLKLSAVSKGRFKRDENKALSVIEDEEQPLALRKGDILITRGNTPELVADVAYVPEDEPSLLLPDLIYRLRIKEKGILAEYLTSFLTTAAARVQIRRDARGSSGSMVKVSQGHVLDWLTTLPPLFEQEEIMNLLRSADEGFQSVEREVSSSLTLLAERRAALITAAVTGQIPTEELKR